MKGKHPKRRKAKDNPYSICEVDGRYVLSFKDGEGNQDAWLSVPLVKISGLLGHTSIHTTYEYYCDVMDETDKIIAFMNDTFVPAKTGTEG